MLKSNLYTIIKAILLKSYALLCALSVFEKCSKTVVVRALRAVSNILCISNKI